MSTRASRPYVITGPLVEVNLDGRSWQLTLDQLDTFRETAMSKPATPLGPYALSVLDSLARNGPQPRQAINPGAVRRLMHDKLIELVELPSPYVSHKGKVIEHLRLTLEGIHHKAARP